MLFFVTFAEATSLLIDADGEGDARKIALQVSEGEQPAKVVPLPARVFVAEVVIEEDDEDEDGGIPVFVEPLGHVSEVLYSLEIGEEPCGDTIEDGASGGVLVCDLTRNHAGEHSCTDPGDPNGRATWTSEEGGRDGTH